MLISKIGEFGLIERFKKLIKLDSTVIKGIGDDCAIISWSKDKYQLFTCDMIVEDVDFTLKDRPELMGRKALAITISDIASCGGVPRYALVSMGVPKKMTVSQMDRIFQGLFNLAKKYRINIVGGDLSSSDKLIIDVSMLGIVEKKNLVLRSKAKIGDIIFVTGSLGGSILGKHLTFTPRLKEARYLVKNFKLNAMIDISDGLLQDLGHILKDSNVGAVIYETLIPISRTARGLEDALYMGEDFELLFSLSRNQAKKLLKKKLNSFRPLGEIVDKKYRLTLVDKNGKERTIRPKGFQHF